MQALSQEVYSLLIRKLLKKELLPGDMLNRRKVAEELNVSVAPVLEAMLQLELEGFLVSIPRKGTLVRPIYREDIKGQQVLREALECQAARMYCGEPVRRNVKRLKELAEQADQAEPQSAERSIRETAFHRALVELAECPALAETYNRNMRVGQFISINQPKLAHVHQDHCGNKKLVDELLAASPDQAEILIRRHIHSSQERSCHGDEYVLHAT